MSDVKTVDILGVPFAVITQSEALDLLRGFLDTASNHIVVTPNPEGVMQARRNRRFHDALINADLALADGTGIVVASRLRGKVRLPMRVRGYDTTIALFEQISAADTPRTVYLLGAADGIPQKAKEAIEARYENIRVVGYHHGFFTPADEEKILAEINALSPDILLVCTGMPRAEIWAAENRDMSARITLCVGGTMDILAGNVKLAPAFMRRVGLEWLYRLVSQPSRFLRMLDIPRFMFAVLFKK